MEIPLKKEELLQVAEEMAGDCSVFIKEWRKTNRAATELPRDPIFTHMADKLIGFLEALYFSGILGAGEVKNVLRLAFPTFHERLKLQGPMPSMFADFVRGIESIDELGKEGA